MAVSNARFAANADVLAASENKPPLKQGAKGEGVAILQQALIDLGFDMPVSSQGGTQLPDGIYGKETTATVRAFQSANGLQADGIAGRQTFARLEQLIALKGQIEEARYRAEMPRIVQKA